MQVGLLALALSLAPANPPLAVAPARETPSTAPIAETPLAPPPAGALPPLLVELARTKTAPPQGATPPDRVRIEGTLLRQALGGENGETVVAYRLADARVAYEGSKDIYPAAMVGAPFLAHYDATGLLTRVELAKAVTTPVRDALHHLIAKLQLVSPADGASAADSGALPSAWEASLNEPRHRALVRFSAAAGAPAGVQRFERRLIAKDKLQTGPSRRARYVVRSSSGHVDWSARDNAVVAVVLDDVALLQYRGTPGYELTTHMTAALAPTRGAATDVPMPATLAEGRALLDDGRARRLHFYRMSPDEVRRARGLDLQTVMARFLAVVDEKPSEAAQLLKDYVRLYPEQSLAVAEHANRLKETKENLPRVGFVYSAMAAAGHEEAQRALAAVLEERRFNALNKDRAARATLSLKRPERFLEPTLWAYRQRLDTSSQNKRQYKELITNVYGALGGFEHGEPELTRAVVSRLLDEYRGVRDPVKASVLLPALGNTGDFTTLWPVFEPLFRHPHPAVRRRAFYVFQKAYSESAFALLAERYDAEQDYAVRLAASAIVEVMPRIDARLEWALERAPKTRDPVILGRMVRILGDQMNSSPRVRDTLVALLEQPIDDDTRRLIYRYVTPGRRGGAQ